MLKVSARSVTSARNVIEKADPKLIADVEQGKVSVSAAAKTVQSDAAQAAARTADKYLPRSVEPAAAPKTIGGNLRLDLVSHKGTLKAWMAQHKGDARRSWPPLPRLWKLLRSTCRRPWSSKRKASGNETLALRPARPWWHD
jgi:hypothetical protein